MFGSHMRCEEAVPAKHVQIDAWDQSSKPLTGGPTQYEWAVRNLSIALREAVPSRTMAGNISSSRSLLSYLLRRDEPDFLLML
jgi:hypothetical protein